jgi:PAS domain S-box-containing protein
MISPSNQSSPDDRRYRLLVDSIKDYAIYMLDGEGRVTSWNLGAQRFKGYHATEIIGEHFSRFYRDEDQANGLPQRALQTALDEGQFEAEGWRVRKDGTNFWAHVVIDPVFDESGEHIGFAKITRDLTERAEAQATLRRSESQFQLLVQSVTDYAIYMLDPRGNVSSWNAGAERIKGYAPDEIIGQNFSRFYSVDDQHAGAPQRALATAEREGRFSVEAWRYRKDGSRFWASVVIDPIYTEAGAIAGFAKVTRDLTEREETQRELEHAREALFQSQKMEAIGQLTGGVAHDFNNLLMATLGSLELLRKHVADNPRALKLLENVRQGAERGATLTQRMLAFARRQDLTPVRVNIPQLVAGLSDLITRSLGPSIAIDTRFPLGLAPVLADINQLEMALLNLVVNARDAMPDGGEITITASPHHLPGGEAVGGGDFVALSVIDKGTGMDADTLQRAMEPFFTTKGIGKGTGLGLAMVHGLAEQLGGRFTMRSEPGEGTTATLWLPVADAPQEDEAVAPQDPPEQTVQRSLKILSVDDDALVLMNTVALLEDLGHRVLEASSGEEALKIFRNEPDIDLVITDQAMPQMTGVQFATAAQSERPAVRFILATGYGELSPGTQIKMIKLNKPFGRRELAASIAAAVE